ncbi:IS110 family transposase [Streptohalobacillus salinus]|nr:IS110 family transposase [Streptohalobacillus salinus]
MALDISKGKSYVVIYDQGECVDEWELKHNQSGFHQLREKLRDFDTKVVFEATGVYSCQIETFLISEGIAFSKLNPLLAKMQTDVLRGNKTDKVDAHKLAQSHYRFDRELTQPQTSVYTELHEVSSLYNEVHETLMKEKNYLHAGLQKVFPEAEKLYSENLSQFTLNVIEKFAHPAYVLEISKTKIKNHILAGTMKKISQEEAKRKAEELIKMAEESYPSVNKDHFAVTKVQFRIKRIRELLKMKETLSAKMIKLTEELSEFHILVSIPGIGPLSAALLISELGDIRRFSTSNKINAFVGIDIRTHQSGTITKKERINKRGNARARMILFFIVRNMLRTQKSSPNHIVDYYYKLRKQPYHKRDKVAMIACINKLLKVVHFLINKNELYDYALSPHS